MKGAGALGGVRATFRLARRDAWRNKGRSALIAVMVALPVLVLSVVSVLARSSELEPRDDVAVQLGDRAQAVLQAAAPGTPIVQAPGLGWMSVEQFAWEEGGQQGDSPQLPAVNEVSPQQISTQMTSLVPPGDRLLLDRRASADRSILYEDRALSPRLREFGYTAAGTGGMVNQVSGRAPRATGEVVVTRTMARSTGIKVGDQLKATNDGAPVEDLSVVGIVSGLSSLGSDEIIGRPGDLIADGSDVNGDTSWVVTGDAPFTWAQAKAANQLGFSVTSRDVNLNPPAEALDLRKRMQAVWSNGSTDVDAVAVGVVVVGLVLLQLALLAGPAIAVGARRSERTLALVSANGGLPRQLRGIVLATSAVIGLVSCIIAAILGAAIGAALIPLLRNYFEQQLPRADIHPLDLLALVAVGALTAAGAALIPARLAARLNVIAVLTGRRGQVAPARRVPIIGLLIAAAGAACTFYGATQRKEVLTVVGIAITEIGLITATGAIIALFARLGRFLPFASRFALRDAARQRGRTAPAVAAVMAAIAGSVAASVYLSSQDAHWRDTFQLQMPLGTVAVTYDVLPFSSSGATTARSPGGSAVESAQVKADRTAEAAQIYRAVDTELRRTLPVKDVAPFLAPEPSRTSYTDFALLLPLDQACPSVSPFSRADEKQGSFCTPDAPELLEPGLASAIFGNGRLAGMLTGHPEPEATAALNAGKVVTFQKEFIWPDGTVHVNVTKSDYSTENLKPATTMTKLPAVYVRSAPGLNRPIYPPAAAKLLGVTIVPQGMVATTTRMPSTAEEERAIAAVDKIVAGYPFVQRSYQSDLGLTLLALVGAAGLITLAGTFTAVGLARAEGAADVATLAAVGASPGVRRRLSAAQAGVITGIGAALGLVTGLMVGWSLVKLSGPGSVNPAEWVAMPDQAPWPVAIPWLMVLAAVIGVPLIAIVLSFVFTRSRLQLIRRVGQ